MRNALKSGKAQIELNGNTNNIIIENNTIDGDARTAGVFTTDDVADIFSDANNFVNCEQEKNGKGFTDSRPLFECGCETTKSAHYRHLERK